MLICFYNKNFKSLITMNKSESILIPEKSIPKSDGTEHVQMKIS